MTKRTLPDTASVAHTRPGDARLHAPSAARNSHAIANVLKKHAPTSGTALELASGTGQHVVEFAAAMPGLIWQPTEVDNARLTSIDAWAGTAKLANVLPAQPLDAAYAGWSQSWLDSNLILAINVLHLISTPEAETLIREAAHALAGDGCLFLYGPFLRNGVATSDGDAQFHVSIQSSDPKLGYKNDRDIEHWLNSAGLNLIDVVEMPANNLSFIARRQA